MAELGIVPIPQSNPNCRQLIDHFLHLVSNATKYTNRLSNFPGTMPMTLSRRHLDMVCLNDYVCLEKSDGTRYMLFAVESHVVLIDRRMHVYVIEPNPQILSNVSGAGQENTILDGELTYNMITEQFEYLIYDAVAIDGDLSVAQLGFRERMQAAENFVAGPRTWQPFVAGLLRLRIKDFYERNQIRKLFDNIRKNGQDKYIYMNNNRRDGVLCNENDGIIFAPVGKPYQIKNSNLLLKWKPPHLNSVDFQMILKPTFDQRRKERSVKLSVAYKSNNNANQEFREVYVPFKYRKHWTNNFDAFNNSIAEFAFDRSAGEWRYLRQREDKDIPNFQNTIINTLETIAEAIEREELVLKMENTKDADIDQQKFVQFNHNNVLKCTYVDDYFDSNNHAYLTATPVSLTPPPSLPPPHQHHYNQQQQNHYQKDNRRSGQRHHEHHQNNHPPSNRDGNHSHSTANGDSARRRDGPAASERGEKKSQGRDPFVYPDDV